jgi:hypothetical protein
MDTPCPGCGCAVFAAAQRDVTALLSLIDSQAAETRQNGGQPYFTRAVNGTNMICAQCGLELKAALVMVTPTEERPTKDILAIWNTRSRVSTAALPVDALVQLLNAALLHPESAEENIRRVIEELQRPTSVAQAPRDENERLRIHVDGLIHDLATFNFRGLKDHEAPPSVRMSLYGVLSDMQKRAREVDASPAALSEGERDA